MGSMGFKFSMISIDCVCEYDASTSSRAETAILKLSKIYYYLLPY